jgi:short-subunit dehydrogenase
MNAQMKDRYGEWALVAGAAEGLGASFARALASEAINLILVDQQKETLDQLAGELANTSGLQLKVLHLDLASAEGVERLMDPVRETGCRLLVYNAAFSRVQNFLANDAKMLDRYVQVNIRTPMHLVHTFCQLHDGKKDLRKGIVLMSSLAGSWGTQLLGPYGGSKAFTQILAESLNYELRDQGFDVLACMAGPTATPGYLASLPQGKRHAIAVMHPDKVVRATLRSLGRRPFVIPGFRNQTNYFVMTRILPRSISWKLMNRAVGKLYREKL